MYTDLIWQIKSLQILVLCYLYSFMTRKAQMKISLNINNQDLSAYSGWLMLWGVAFIIIGLLALSATTFTTLMSVVLLGVFLLLGGTIVLIDTLTFWWGRWRGFFLHLLMSLLYITVGIMCVKNPTESSISLTLLLGVFYMVAGIFRITYAIALPLPRFGLRLLSGVLALLLGILIMASWPSSSLYIIGLFVGIDLFFLGWTYFMTGMFTRKLAK